MNNYFYLQISIFIIGVFFSSANGQQPTIGNKHIWNALYPNMVKSFDSNENLIKKVQEGEYVQEYRTQISKKIYFKSANTQHVIVPLFTYRYSEGEKDMCRSCGPAMGIARFEFTNNIWQLKQFVEEWSEIGLQFGEEPTLITESLNSKMCLKVVYDTTKKGEDGGDFKIEAYFDAIDFSLIKTSMTRID